ncbi:MAG: hypothetical protein KKE23_01590 [Nanoarchaeota archaeon]|nr:hypothetical protein [Nanoarchaeota archaeon]
MTEGQRQVSVDVSKAVPLFADEVLIASKIKAFKDDKKVEKEGVIELLFLDQLSSPPKAISRIVISRATAKSLLKVLDENVKKMEKDLKDKNLPKTPIKVDAPKHSEKGYFG